MLSLSVLRTKIFRSLIVCKAFYHLDLAQNFSYLALLATQNYAAHPKTDPYYFSATYLGKAVHSWFRAHLVFGKAYSLETDGICRENDRATMKWH